MTSEIKGLLLVDKPVGKSSFSLVATLRRCLGVKKIGHCGTLDPLASGLMVMLIGREYTRLSDKLLCEDKEYLATIMLGASTDTYDSEGQISKKSSVIPSLEELQDGLKTFQGQISQIPPMYSAKKQQGRKLYELARKGIEVERQPVLITVDIELIRYDFPFVELRIACSKGTYIRSIAHDLGELLGCYGHLTGLRRTRSGSFHIDQSIDGSQLESNSSLVSALQSLSISNAETLIATKTCRTSH